ncbi:serine/threonine-protein kinase [Cadophora sp. DSE1049]|nr:serine/threonine-protein kinase [Cadophora sp. DSE1049]
MDIQVKSTTSTEIIQSSEEPVGTLMLPPPPKALHLGLFGIGKPLGKGKFGRVYLAMHRPSGFICALKTLYKDQIVREGAENLVRREIEVHGNLQHPGVLKFYNHFHDSKRIFLILEYAAGGELYKLLQKEKHFREPKAAKYLAQVADSLRYLHSKHVMHRDIKPENILIGLHGELKLADFGYSVHSTSNRRHTLCGTLDYLPPEMITSGKMHYTSAIDLWTLGVLAYEFLMGEAPFEDSQVMTQRRIARNEMTPLSASLSQGAKDFVHSVCFLVKLYISKLANHTRQLLVLDPSKRLSLDGVLHHPWIQKHCDNK